MGMPLARNAKAVERIVVVWFGFAWMRDNDAPSSTTF